MHTVVLQIQTRSTGIRRRVLTGVESRFQRAMSCSNHRIGLGATALLAWLAASDGKISADELKLLRELAGKQLPAAELEVALDFARESQLDDLTLACQVVRELPRKSQRTFLKWALRVATSNGKLSVPMNYILRFFADLTDLDVGEAYSTAAGFPLPGDASSIEWWKVQESATAGTDKTSQSSQEQDGKRKKSGAQMTRAEALAILGLEEHASQVEVAQAFRRLAISNHPDRFAQSGPATQHVASRNFARIRKAFETLSQA